MPLFALTAVQSVLLAVHAPVVAIAAAAIVAGFSFSYGSVLYETGVQRVVAPERLSRVSAYSWMCAMAFLPAGYALAGPVASLVGMKTYLLVGAAWIVVSCLAVLAVPDVRSFRLTPAEHVPDASVAVPS
jgi:uncharacterized membrane protein